MVHYKVLKYQGIKCHRSHNADVHSARAFIVSFLSDIFWVFVEFPITESHILNLHRRVLSVDPDNAGEYRTRAVFVGNFAPPNQAEVWVLKLLYDIITGVAITRHKLVPLPPITSLFLAFFFFDFRESDIYKSLDYALSTRKFRAYIVWWQ